MERTFLHRLFFRIYKWAYISAVIIGRQLLGIEYAARAIGRGPAQAVPILLRRFGATVGHRVNFKDGLRIDNASGDMDARGDFSNINIGDKCYIGKGVLLDLPDKIVLDDDVILSANVTILTHSDCGDRLMAKWYPRKRAPVRLGQGTWVGANAVIMCGVELGTCCVVAAGSVVSESFPDFSVVAGIPAKLVKKLEVPS